jgi:exodeoxyribonuclease VII large subunit
LARVERAGQLLGALSYQGVLARGFALVRDAVGKPLRAAANVNPGHVLDIEFHDGRVAALVTRRSTVAPVPPLARPARPRLRGPRGGEGQGDLF